MNCGDCFCETSELNVKNDILGQTPKNERLGANRANARPGNRGVKMKMCGGCGIFLLRTNIRRSKALFCVSKDGYVIKINVTLRVNVGGLLQNPNPVYVSTDWLAPVSLIADEVIQPPTVFQGCIVRVGH
jgi:hypothetical protein